MISQILQRDFMLKRLEELQATLGTFESAALSAGEAGWRVTQEACRLARAAASQALTRCQGEAKPGEDVAYFPREPVIGLFQTALEEYFHTQRPALVLPIEPPPRYSLRDGSDEVPVTDLELVETIDSRARKLFDKFSQLDLLWTASLVAEGVRLLTKKHNFNPNPPAPFEIGDQARVLLVGDWGTGIPRARKVAAAMRRVLDDGKAEGRQQHVIHLGDVYYSGWGGEYKDRFLKYWPVREGEAESITSWSLNGNHDMYSGGGGYFDVLLNDRRFKVQRGCSFFSLFNRHWRILGLDTAFEDHGLLDPQANWVGLQLADKDRKGLLLSHHQMFSSYEGGGEIVEEKLGAILGQDLVRAWFWGHEHRCVLYKPHKRIQYARCIGHGGVPVYASLGSPPDLVEYAFQDYLRRGLEKWALFGFAVLDLDGPRIHVRYIDENGRQHHQENIE